MDVRQSILGRENCSLRILVHKRQLVVLGSYERGSVDKLQTLLIAYDFQLCFDAVQSHNKLVSPATLLLIISENVWGLKFFERLFYVNLEKKLYASADGTLNRDDLARHIICRYSRKLPRRPNTTARCHLSSKTIHRIYLSIFKLLFN